MKLETEARHVQRVHTSSVVSILHSMMHVRCTAYNLLGHFFPGMGRIVIYKQGGTCVLCKTLPLLLNPEEGWLFAFNAYCYGVFVCYSFL